MKSWSPCADASAARTRPRVWQRWLLGLASGSAAQGKRPLAVGNLYDVRDVRDPQRSPDGGWVAYTVTRAIRDTDKNDTDVWMVSWDGRERVQVTSSPDSESRPRWSPDGKFLAFVSSRQDSKAAQVWLLNRSGGEAVRLTDVKGGVTDYAWAPDSRRLALVVADPDPAVPAEDDEADDTAKGAAAKTPKPIVVDRYHLQVRLRRLSPWRTQPPVPVRPDVEEERDPHTGKVRRVLARLVARWPPDRVRPAPSRRRRRRQDAERRCVRHRRAFRRVAAPPDDDHGGGERSSGLEPGRTMDRLSARGRGQVFRLRSSPDRRDSVRRRGSAHADGRARPARDRSRVVGRRAQPALRRRRRPRSVHRTGAPRWRTR